ncbi:exodeoxyribonuclease VII small subunit [Bythopirellula polymerisocia]|uniref:Exodeoxyribonuclease 7 small subunit n=1 Tax=Bythopirellula polymerisocia TaxID=2528003 RepID=A0A5C6CK53_9BACT|nr:exodeoxyribonuclease VII small subunit [Bythopirellula polymerisocia]TWU23824.1 Exodeoxyribonuclease 7 small subunit [Bythopirellula polymerisocia]
MAKKKTTQEQPVFEQSLKELEGIVGKLESGKLGLEESLEHYESGMRHLKQCNELLRSAERRIALVTGLDADGNAVTESFAAEDEESLTAKGDARSRRRSSAGKRRSASEVDDDSSLF